MIDRMYGLAKGSGGVKNHSVDYNCGDKSDVNETSDQYIEWNHSIRVYIFK